MRVSPPLASPTPIGYHASHEQFPPGRLLELARRAESAGFGAAMCSDHLMPWGEAQGESGFAWSWLGAALQATRLSFGVVTAPVDRYHPVTIAHAAATLAAMYPGRFWIAVGSGERVNEHVTGRPWPAKEERNARLLEAVGILRALWRGETVTHRGRWFAVDEARLYTLPETPPLLVAAAIGPRTAAWAADWAEALVTVSQPAGAHLRTADAFRDAGGDGKPVLLQAKHAWAPDGAEALRGAHEQWRGNVLGGRVLANLALPEAFDEAAAFVRPEDVAEAVRVSSDLERHLAWLREDLDAGFDRVYLHDVGPEQERTIDAFGEHVLPALADPAAEGDAS